MQLVDVQIKECEGFLSRAHAHLADAKRTVYANIHDAEKWLEALQKMQQFSPPPPVDLEAVLRLFREKVAQLQGQLEGVRPALAEGQVSKRIRFHSQLRGRVSGVDRSKTKTGRLSRCTVVGETRRGRQDQRRDGERGSPQQRSFCDQRRWLENHWTARSSYVV